MFKKLLVLFGFIGLLVPAVAAQQTGTVQGTVTNKQNGKPVVGANVFIQSINKGSATNADGKFTINDVPYGKYKLRVSFIGFTTKNITINVNQSTVTVNTTLSSSTAKLNNIVVTAQGVKQTERSIGSSVQEVTGNELAESHTSNFSASLQGKVAGLNINQSPTIGGSSNVIMRGIKSITGNNQPLYVIDGIPFEKQDFNTLNAQRGAGGYSYSSPLANINSDNIESVTVLKGAAATALYGSRGANGVIKIQTKSGAGKKGIGISLRQDVTLSSVYGLPDYQEKYGGGPGYDSFVKGSTFNRNHADDIAAGNLQKEPADQYFANYSDDESWGPRLDGRMVRQWYSFDDINGLKGKATPWVAPPNNNVKNFFNTGVALGTHIGISSGGDNYNYRLTMSRKGDNGVTPLAKQRQKEFGFNGNIDLSDKVHAQVLGNYSINNYSHLPATGYEDRNVFQQFNQFGQNQLNYGPNGYLADYEYPDGSSRSWNYNDIAAGQTNHHIFHDSPYWVRHKNYANQNTKRFYGKVGLTYDIASFLSLNGQVKTNYYNDRRDSRTAQTSVPLSDYSQDVRSVQETDADVRLTYKQDISESISLNAFVQGEVRYNNLHHDAEATSAGLVAPGVYNVQNSVSRPTVTDYYEQQRHDIILGQVRAGYNNLLFITLSGRNEWASTLPKSNNSYQYYAATGSFIFTDLGSLKDNDVLSFGKIRLSYAKSGNGADPYSLALTYPLSQPFGSLPYQSVPTTLNNANLKPEATHELDVGANLKFLNNRVGINFTYYRIKSTDEIIPISVSSASGYAYQYVNAGELDNNGVEATLNATPIQQSGFSWDITLNYAKNNNKVVKLAPGIHNYLIGNATFTNTVNAHEGMPYGEIKGPVFKTKDGKKLVDDNGYYEASSTQEYFGSYQPDWTGSVSTTFHYKGFAASFAFNGQKGGEVFSVSNMFGLDSGMMQPTARGDIRELGLIAKGVNADGEPNTTVADANGFFENLFGIGRAFTYDASYIKFQQARLAYSIPVQTFSGTPIHGLSVAVFGRNLMTIFKNAPNFDPSTVISAGNFQGNESGRTPAQRAYGFSIQIKF
jgi:TonB-linked SusC/RagA family outer membrane protein